MTRAIKRDDWIRFVVSNRAICERHTNTHTHTYTRIKYFIIYHQKKDMYEKPNAKLMIALLLHNISLFVISRVPYYFCLFFFF